MEANGFWVVLALVALVLAVLMRRQRAIAAEAEELRGGRSAHPYHCVAIKSGMGACEQARRIRGRRYLSGEAPLVPLPGCGARDCTCVYVHFEDRRQGSRRHVLAPPPHAEGAGGRDRRTSPGRRKSDLVAVHVGH